MDIKRIRYFLTLARSLNFSEAARGIGISQPALSKAIKQLESSVGGALLRREGRLTHLTQLGEQMRVAFSEVERSMVAAENVAQAFSASQNHDLRLAVMCTIDPLRFGSFLKAQKEFGQTTSLEIRDASTTSIQETLLSGRVDMAVIGTPVEVLPRLRVVELYREDMILACARDHPLSGRKSVSFQRLGQYPYLDRLHCEFRDMVLTKAQEQNLAMNIVLRSEREDWIGSMVQQGVGITLMPKGLAQASKLATIPFNDITLVRSVCLAVPRGREDRAATRKFIALAREFDWDDVAPEVEA